MPELWASLIKFHRKLRHKRTWKSPGVRRPTIISKGIRFKSHLITGARPMLAGTRFKFSISRHIYMADSGCLIAGYGFFASGEVFFIEPCSPKDYNITFEFFLNFLHQIPIFLKWIQNFYFYCDNFSVNFPVILQFSQFQFLLSKSFYFFPALIFSSNCSFMLIFCFFISNFL